MTKTRSPDRKIVFGSMVGFGLAGLFIPALVWQILGWVSARNGGHPFPIRDEALATLVAAGVPLGLGIGTAIWVYNFGSAERQYEDAATREADREVLAVLKKHVAMAKWADARADRVNALKTVRDTVALLKSVLFKAELVDHCSRLEQAPKTQFATRQRDFIDKIDQSLRIP
jgi:hypothetical protein